MFLDTIKAFDSDGLAPRKSYLTGPITDTGVYDEVYEVVVNDKSTGKIYKTSTEANAAALMQALKFKRKVGVRPRPKSSIGPPQSSKETFRTPTGKLTVPAGTLVYVYRRQKGLGKPDGWFKYHLKKERTFQEHHQVTTMNQGLLRTMAVKLLSNKQWITFHTEEEAYPLIAFSALTTEFPLEGQDGVHPLGEQPGDTFPFQTPLKYPPHGNIFERLFNEQKSAFLFKEGFKVGFESRKELDNK